MRGVRMYVHGRIQDGTALRGMPGSGESLA